MSSAERSIQDCLTSFLQKTKIKKEGLTEEELRRVFTETGILELLGYKEIGKDVRFEKTIQKEGKRPDIQCLDEFGNICFIIEFKKPSDPTILKEHFPQLWDKYVIPLKARFGILTNGKSIVIYERIALNPHTVLDKDLDEIDEKDNNLILSKLQKPTYDMTQTSRILDYFKKFSDDNERRSLDSELGRELFFEDFVLSEFSPFSNLVKGCIGLFDSEYGKSKFLTSAYDFWLKSYAKKPDKIPESWKRMLKSFGLSTSDDDLNKFMFCLETSYSLFTRLILAKACEDHQFPHINFGEYLGTIKKYSYRGDIPLVAWGILLTQWIENLREGLVESVFEEDIFYWWTTRFSIMSGWSVSDIFSGKVDVELISFSKYIAKVVLTLYKYDFSKITGDPLGDLYQKYFDKETRKALGEFYTPKETVSYILDNVKYDGQFIIDKRLLDPACGSGTFIVDALKRYLKSAESKAEEHGWAVVLKKLCNEFHIVGFDIHPFATIMSQIHFMLVLIPYYKKAIEEEKGFTLRRIPIFRTDSLIDERKGKKTDLTSFIEGTNSVQLTIPLPIKRGITDEEFVEIEILMPRSQEVWDKTDLRNIPEYFCALQALFDTVKYQGRNENYSFDKDLMERRLKEYLSEKDWKNLVNFFTPYADQLLSSIKDLKYKFGDGRLIKSIEDVMLAGLLKNYVEYDYVVGNPPYVRIQFLDPTQIEYLRNNYKTAYKNFDLYILFLERGLFWCRNGGTLGFIISDQFMKADYGEKLRGFLSEMSSIKQIIDFTDTGVFEDATNYPVIIILNRSNPVKDDEFTVVRVAKPIDDILTKIRAAISSGISNWEEFDIFQCDSTYLGKSPWLLMPEEELKTFQKIRQAAQFSLSDIKTDIYQGLVTGIDSVFLMRVKHFDEKNAYVQPVGLDKEYIVERALLHKVLKGYNVIRWHPFWGDLWILFPYLPCEKGVQLISKEGLQKVYPHAWEYFLLREKELKLREKGKWTKRIDWYAFGRTQNLNKMEIRKILVQVLARHNTFAFDERGEFHFIGAGGSNAYGITIKNEIDDKKISEYFIVGILNSNLTEFYLKHISQLYSGKYYIYSEQFLDLLPIRLPENEHECNIEDSIVKRVEKILNSTEKARSLIKFPNSYINRMRNLELDEISHIFKSNQDPIRTSIVKLADGTFGIKFEKGDETIPVESHLRAVYCTIALNGIGKKGEKVKILIPRDEEKIKEILKSYSQDKEDLEKEPISKLEDEIDDLVYEFYNIDEKDKKVIGGFLEKF